MIIAPPDDSWKGAIWEEVKALWQPFGARIVEVSVDLDPQIALDDWVMSRREEEVRVVLEAAKRRAYHRTEASKVVKKQAKVEPVDV